MCRETCHYLLRRRLCRFIADVSGFAIAMKEKIVSKGEHSFGLGLGKKDSEHAIGFQSLQGYIYSYHYYISELTWPTLKRHLRSSPVIIGWRHCSYLSCENSSRGKFLC